MRLTAIANAYISPACFAQIAHCFPRQRGNVKLSNAQVLSALLHVAESDCPWSQLPDHYGNWHTIYTRIRRWERAGVLDLLFAEMQRLHMIRLRLEVDPWACWTIPQPLPAEADARERPRMLWMPRIADIERGPPPD